MITCSNARGRSIYNGIIIWPLPHSSLTKKIKGGQLLTKIHFLCLATKKVVGYYVTPSEILTDRPSVSAPTIRVPATTPTVLAKPFQTLQALLGWSEDMHIFCSPPFRRKAEGHCFWFSVGRGAWFRIFSRYFVPLTPPTVFVRSFWNFTGVLRMVWRCACGFFRILKLFFITFYTFWT